MLKKTQRLTKKKEFDNVFSRGRSGFNYFFGVKSIKNELKNNRFGILVSNKISKKATERNKIKRKIRAAIKEAENRIIPGFDFVIIALPTCREADFLKIKKGLEESLKKLRLLK